VKDAKISLRTDSKLKQQAEVYAQETGRTLAGLIEWLLRKELNHAGSLKRGGQGRFIMNKIEMVKEYIQDQIQEHGFENNQIEIDFADICEVEETIQAAKELGYLATPGEGQGVWWIYTEE
jgi:hypothetical protein